MGNCFESKGSEQKSQSTTETKTEEQKQGIKQALELYLPQLGINESVWPGQRVTPFSTLQQGAVNDVTNLANSALFSTPQTADTPLFSETGDALKGLLTGKTGAKPMDSGDVEDYFKGAIYDPTMQSLEEDVLPGIDEDFAGPGFWGSARSQEKVSARQGTADTLNAQRAGLEWDVLTRNQEIEESKAGRVQTAVGQGMQYSELPAQQIKNNLQIAASQLGNVGTVFGFGQAEQTQAQAELQAEIIKFAEENAITDPENLAIILALLGMNFSSSQSSSSGESWGAGMARQWLTPTGGLAG